MKVVHLCWGLTYGGIETMLVNIANAQASLGAAVTVIVVNDYVEPELLCRIRPDIHVVRIDRKRGSRNFGFLNRIATALDEINPDIVHIHGGPLYDVLPRKWRYGNVCCTLHASPEGRVGSSLRCLRLFSYFILHKGGNIINLNRVKRVFSISESVAGSLKSSSGLESTVVANGIRTELFKVRESLPFQGELKILQVSRLCHDKKGQDLLIEAVSKLRTEGIDCHLSFIGDGPSRQFLEDLCRQKGLEQSVTFLGKQNQDYIARRLCEYDLFAQPSRYEGFGLTVAEAMAAGVPVLVSRGQGPAEVTENDNYGWTFTCADVDDLSKQISHIVMQYGECLKKAEKARRHVAEKYDVRVTAANYLEQYKLLLQN